MGSIPWTAIDRYAVRHEFSGRQYETLLRACAEMDERMREWNKNQKDT